MLSYLVNDIWTTGKVWDISQTGYRTTGERPLPIGLETIVFLTLRNGDALHHILIESAIVRWSDGHHAGWEILRMDALSQVSLADVMKQCDPSYVTSDALLIHA
jgi:hypothetical protein